MGVAIYMKPKQANILQALNPSDYFTLAMDEEIRREGMPGSLCGFALELNQRPDAALLGARITEFLIKFPVSSASLQQRGKHFYWCTRDTPRQAFFQHSCPAGQNDEAFQQTTIETLINQHENREEVSPVEFHLLAGSEKHIFFMRWIHPFCDARGADLILKYLCTDDARKRELFNKPVSKPLVIMQLDKFRWWQKIGLFLKAKRHIEHLDQLQSISPITQQDNPLTAKKLHYSVRRLSEEQSAQITQQTRRHVGLTGTSLYYLGCMMRALEKSNPHQPGEAYCVPYAFNLRKNKALTPVLANHVGALFAQAPRAIVQDREQLFRHLKQQNAESIRQQLDYAFLPLMWAARWLSLEKYGKTLRQSYKTGEERSSFWFSDIGQPDLSGQRFFGADITGLFHLSQISSPPALALLSCHYQNRLTLTYNYIEPMFNKVWIDELHETMLMELLDS